MPKKIWLLTCLAVLLAPLAAEAAAGSWADRARAATLVVVARCESASADWEGAAIYTRSDVTVLDVVRGTPDHRTTVRQPGGVVDGVGQRVSHVTLLEPGATYLLFLAKDEAGGWSPTRLGVNAVTGSPGAETVGGESLAAVIATLGGGN